MATRYAKSKPKPAPAARPTAVDCTLRAISPQITPTIIPLMLDSIMMVPTCGTDFRGKPGSGSIDRTQHCPGDDSYQRFVHLSRTSTPLFRGSTAYFTAGRMKKQKEFHDQVGAEQQEQHLILTPEAGQAFAHGIAISGDRKAVGKRLTSEASCCDVADTARRVQARRLCARWPQGDGQATQASCRRGCVPGRRRRSVRPAAGRPAAIVPAPCSAAFRPRARRPRPGRAPLPSPPRRPRRTCPP